MTFSVSFDPAAGRHKLHQPPFTVGLRNSGPGAAS